MGPTALLESSTCNALPVVHHSAMHSKLKVRDINPISVNPPPPNHKQPHNMPFDKCPVAALDTFHALPRKTKALSVTPRSTEIDLHCVCWERGWQTPARIFVGQPKHLEKGPRHRRLRRLPDASYEMCPIPICRANDSSVGQLRRFPTSRLNSRARANPHASCY